MSPKYEITKVGTLPFGGWYWTRLGPDGNPSEPVNSHGPYLFRCLAVHAARKAMR